MIDSYKGYSGKKTLTVGKVKALFIIFIAATGLILIITRSGYFFPTVVNSDDQLLSEPIVIVWELVETGSDYHSASPMEPVQVVSPTWFHLDDSYGNIRSSFDPAYLQWARERGLQVWALVTNSFDPEITAAVLSDDRLRLQFAARLVELALDYELDGLNIDFENFHSDYRDHFTLFISELAEKCRDHDLVISVDVTRPSNSEYWSLCYDHAALAAEVDYVILMAYDEHWKQSPIAGSVASLPWVEESIELTLKKVPPEKLILGVPFYTRLWEIDQSEETALVLNSWSYSMHRAEEIKEENNAEVYWDAKARQHVAEYTRDGLTYKMWLEDTASMKERLDLVKKYNLAGIAGWRRGLEKTIIWDLIDNYLSDYLSKASSDQAANVP